MHLKTLCEQYDLKPSREIPDFEIKGVTSLDNQKDNFLSWIKESKYLIQAKKGVFIVSQLLESHIVQSEALFLFSEFSPKLTFSKIIRNHFAPHPSYFAKNCVGDFRKRDDLVIHDYVFIGENVSIGEGTILESFVRIEAGSVIGQKCLIKTHSSIGSEGMGLELDPDTNYYQKFPQIGNVILKDEVDVGPHATVRRGALKSTYIGKGSKIGSFVNVGHNCRIGEKCIITSQITIGGSSAIGDCVTLGVGASIRNGISIGDNSELGMGSVLTKSMDGYSVWFGNPAKLIKKLL